MIKYIEKRDGSIAKFNPKNIYNAVYQSAKSCNEFVDVDNVVRLVIERLEKRNQPTINIEIVQDEVEFVLMGLGYFKAAKSYITYRNMRDAQRNLSLGNINAESSVEEYLSRADWRVNANANQGYSLGGMILNVAGKVTANYWLNKIYPKEIGQAHRNGDIHIHDLDMLSIYCCGWSLKNVLREGMNGIAGKIESNPPKHLSSALNQALNHLCCCQNEAAGAQAYSSFDTYMAPYIRLDNLSYKEVKQHLQEFIYNLNVPSRWGCVPTSTEVLTTDGWKDSYTLSMKDKVYSINKRGELCLSTIKRIIHKKNVSKKLIAFRNDHYNYEQLVTPEHRVLVGRTQLSKLDDLKIKRAENISGITNLPVAFTNSIIEDSSPSNEEVMMAAALYCDGSWYYKEKVDTPRVFYFKSPNRQKDSWFEKLCKKLGVVYKKKKVIGDFGSTVNKYVFHSDSARKLTKLVGRKTRIDEKFLNMNREKSQLFLDTWMAHDGQEEKHILQFDTLAIAKGLQHIAVNACKTSSIVKIHKSQYVKLRGVEMLGVKQIQQIDYDGEVWCPSLTMGTAIFRDKNGGVFISGQTQTPFTNLTFDWVCPEDLKKEKPVVGGKECDFFYGDLQKEMDMINKAYIEIMLEGDKNGRVFTFPIPTYNMTKEFDWDSENSTLLFEMTAKYGLPYFQNFINSELKPNMIRSMCCRLQLDLRELLKRGNGLFGSAEQTGSVGVVTINCARLGYLFKGDKESLYNRLDYLMDLARNSLELKRKTLKQNMDRGLYPYIKRWLGTLRNHFSTIGVNGINEMIRNFTNDKEDITTEKGHAFATEFLDHVRGKLLSYQSEQGTMYNLEATPAEGTTYRFAKEDKKRFPDIIQAGTPSNPYYTNSSQLPVGYTDDPFEALELQDDLQRKYTGGCCEEGTDVLTDKGIFKIEKLVEDFEKLKPIKVISFNEKNKVSEWKEIDEVYKIDVSSKDKIRVKGENNFEIVTSDWHPFFVSTKKKLASNVCPVCGEAFDNYQGRNNHLAHNPKCREKYHSIKEKVSKERPIIQKRADELVVMDKLIQNSTNLLVSQTPVSKELAYILGFFIGNGYLASTTYKLSFYSGKKDNPLDYLCECLKKEFGIIETPEVWEPTNPNCIEVRITGKEKILPLRKSFEKFGFKPGKKTYTISANPIIPYLDKNNFPSFLSGLLDSDGYIDQQGDGEYATVSTSLYDSLVYLFTMTGINLRIKYRKSKKANEKDFYSLYLKKKYLMKYFDELSPTLQRALILGILKEPKKERQEEVVRVKEVSKTQVSNNQFYDLNIRDNHNYLAGKNGSFVFVHNTVLHLYMNEAISSSDACKKIVKRALTNFKLPYITITPTFSICPIHGYIKGQHEYCPKCDAELLAKKANK